MNQVHPHLIPRFIPLLVLLLALALLCGCQNAQALLHQATLEDAPAQVANLDEIPSFTGQPWTVVDDDRPAFTEAELNAPAATEIYGELDALGRATAAYVLAGPDTLPTQPREPLKYKPTGWIQKTFEKDDPGYDVVGSNHLYERSHLAAYSLSGENDNPLNLVTGTHYMNQTAMKPLEERILSWIRRTNGHVALRVTPVFSGNDLLARGVQMEAWSLEDEGAGISFNRFCHNVQPGIALDYATGASQVEAPVAAMPQAAQDSEPSDAGGASKAAQDAKTIEAPNSAEAGYVLNTRRMKIHRPDCSSVRDIATANRQSTDASLDQLVEQGYSPCARCHP